MIAGACFLRGSGPPHPHTVSWQSVFLVRGAFRRLRAGGRLCIASQYDAIFFSSSCVSRERIDLYPQTTYQRLLVHRCSGYYSLSPRTDTTTKVISVHYSQESRM